MLALPRWVTPNGVTIFRGLLTVPLVWMVLSSMYLHALALFALIMVLDFVDGALAHARNMNSVSGAFLDPLADKIAVCGVLIAVADRLPYMAAPATACVLVAAVFLTLIRIPRLRNGGGSSGVAALNVGKLKLLAETVAISTVLLALATGSAALMTAFLWSIWAAAFLGMASFMGQIAR
jgi:CDP-diacylglycerol--glycerol-3-phosphate 3-phosphatidyltransferase